MGKKAVVLLSGGLDSTTCIAIAKNAGFRIAALTINYGQRHKFELDAAKQIIDHYQINNHSMVDIDLSQFGGSALTDDIEIPKDRSDKDMSDIPVTYVPARNTVFLSLALAWAETLQAFDIFIGVNALDYSGYPDCRPEFIEAFEKMANEATKFSQGEQKIKIHTPLINLTKAEIIIEGSKLNVNYAITHSCYDPSPDGLSCGACDACILRKEGFKAAGVMDPTRYI